MNLTQRCAVADEKLVGVIARKHALVEQLEANRKTMSELAEEKAKLVKCINTLDVLIQTISAKGIGRVETVVTNGLQLVFGPEISCFLEKKEGARGTTYRIRIKKHTEFGDVVEDPFEAFGGGVVNLTAFLLRVLLHHRFKLAKLLVLDESFNNVSTEGGYLERTSELLRSLADDYGFDILTVTHQPELAARAIRGYRITSTGPIGLTELGVGELG